MLGRDHKLLAPELLANAMLYTTVQGGDWHSAATWAPASPTPRNNTSGIPGVGDSVSIVYAVSISEDLEMGDGSSTAVTINAGAVLTINANVNVLVYGNLGGAGNLVQLAGSTLNQVPAMGYVDTDWGIDSYDIGTQVVLRANFYLGQPAQLFDPTGVKIEVAPPGNPGVVNTPFRVSQGVYNYILDLETAGLWQFRWTSSSTPKAAADGQLICRQGLT